MIWQDYLMMVGGFGFAIALLPAVFTKAKPPRSSCLITATILSTYVVALATLGLVLSPIATGLAAMMWWVILFQGRSA